MSNPLIPIDRHQAKESGHAIQQAQDTVMTAGATATVTLIRELLQALKVSQKAVNVKIDINDSVAYQANLNQNWEPSRENLALSDEQLRYLKEVIKLPSSEQKAVASIPLDKNVTITVDGKEVFRLKDGVVQQNLLTPTAQKTVSKPTQTVPTSTTQQPQIKENVQSAQVETSPQNPKIETIPVQNPQVETSPQQPQIEAIPVQSAQIKTSPQNPKVEAIPVQNPQVETSPQNSKVEEKPVASASVEVVGTNVPDSKATNFSFSAEQKQQLQNLGVEPAQIENALGNSSQGNVPIIVVLNREVERNVPKSSLKDNLKSTLSRFHHALRDFSRKVSSFLTSTREKIFPSANRDLKGDLNNIAVTNVASKLLDRFGGATVDGKQMFEGNSFRLQRSGRDLTVTALDGRGTILSLKNGELKGSLSQRDVEKFQAVDRQLELGKTRQSQAEIG
ncbi:hypothetical protein PCC7424_3888 [Gloeothece citriformis PCC 7424]|uniref:Uncharacterized protein n=1 Tax=Gloeothece citriformis (strain PCC 7424) TaxID=65393 RepID=B7KKD4_GLOC7|nr:hypothetical protein [Gloeothece citriformis]ACK72267.1 hypothetical protein PCC7424_3888 [Gloeothece citriformis PCC 7424]